MITHELDTYIGWRIHSADTNISVFISLISYFAISLSDRTVLNTISLKKHKLTICLNTLSVNTDLPHVLQILSLKYRIASICFENNQSENTDLTFKFCFEHN